MGVPVSGIGRGGVSLGGVNLKSYYSNYLDSTTGPYTPYSGDYILDRMSPQKKHLFAKSNNKNKVHFLRTEGNRQAQQDRAKGKSIYGYSGVLGSRGGTDEAIVRTHRLLGA